MPLLRFQQQTYDCAPGETVLDCLTRQGAEVPSSCRIGACQTCMVQAIGGTLPPPPAAAQIGLKPTLRAQGYFLACLCRPQAEMEIALAGEAVAPRTSATVVAKEALNADIMRLSLRCHRPLDYQAGQFAHLIRPDGLARSYSLAGLPNAEGLIEFHIRRLNGGAMSAWVHETLQSGDTLDVVGPFGNCFYTPEAPEQGLLLIGTGSGLAPLWGIVSDALRQGHTGPIRLYHGSWKPEGLYLTEALRKLEAEHPNFVYVPCVDSGALEGCREGRVDQIALADLPNLKGWRLFLCGHPEMVKTTKKRAFLMGASLQDIYADPFVLSPPPAQAEQAA
jgi:CDP-4-dehydro-6-deoxyglucose reductase